MVELDIEINEYLGRTTIDAAAVGLHFGLSLEQIVTGLAAAELTGGRLQSKVIGGIQFIDDSYNANPDSMRAAVQTMTSMDCVGKRYAVFGGMAELGEFSEDAHRTLGEDTVEAGVDYLFSVGAMAAAITKNLNVDGGGAVQHFGHHQG